MSDFIEQYPHIRERLEKDRRWLLRLENVDDFWDEFETRAQAKNVSGIEGLLDANPFRHGTDLRIKADLALSSTESAKEHMIGLAISLQNRWAEMNAIGEQGDAMSARPKQRLDMERESSINEAILLRMLRMDLRRALADAPYPAIYRDYRTSRTRPIETY